MEYVSKVSLQLGQGDAGYIYWHSNLSEVSVEFLGVRAAPVAVRFLRQCPTVYQTTYQDGELIVDVRPNLREGTLLVTIMFDERVIASSELTIHSDVKLDVSKALTPLELSKKDILKYGTIFFGCLFVSGLVLYEMFKLFDSLASHPYGAIVYAFSLSLIAMVAIPRLPVLSKIYDPNRMVRFKLPGKDSH